MLITILIVLHWLYAGNAYISFVSTSVIFLACSIGNRVFIFMYLSVVVLGAVLSFKLSFVRHLKRKL